MLILLLPLLQLLLLLLLLLLLRRCLPHCRCAVMRSLWGQSPTSKG